MISVIVPFYNSEKHLDACIRSIVAQTYTDLELLLIDDGSTDASSRIATQWEQKDERIKYVRKHNGGVSSARNRGLAEAKREYITFVDSDDLCSPHLLEALMQGMTEDTDISTCAIKRFTTDTEVKKLSITLDAPCILLKTINEIYLHLAGNRGLHPPYAKLYRTRIIKEHNIRFDESLSLGEDLCFNLDYLHHVRQATSISLPLYYYRDTAGSLSKDIRPDYADIQLHLLDRKISFCHTHNIHYDFATVAPGILRDMVLSLSHSEASKQQKLQSLRRIRRHKIMQLSHKSASFTDQLFRFIVTYMPSTLLFRILR